MTDPVVTITDLDIGPLRVARVDVTRSEHALGSLLGMDVLGLYCCHFPGRGHGPSAVIRQV